MPEEFGGKDPGPVKNPAKLIDRDASTLTEPQIHRLLTTNIDAGPVPDKDAIPTTIAETEAGVHDRIRQEMDLLEDKLLSGDPHERAVAQSSLESLRNFTFTEGPSVSPIPKEASKISTPIDQAIARTMRVIGDPKADSATIFQANKDLADLRDPDRQDDAAKRILGEIK